MVVIYAPHFVAGHDDNNLAPIISYMRGWSHERIFNYCLIKGWETHLQATIQNVEVEKVSKGKNFWNKAVVSFNDGKADRKQNIVSFKNPEVFKVVQELKEGDIVDVTVQKDGDFWQWSAVQKLAGTGTTTPPTDVVKSGKVVGSNYETKEERAARQVLIVRQSSLKEAVAFVNAAPDRVDYTRENVIELAQYFADWVFGEKDLFTAENDL